MRSDRRESQIYSRERAVSVPPKSSGSWGASPKWTESVRPKRTKQEPFGGSRLPPPAQTPGGRPTWDLMPLIVKSELHKPEEDLQEPGEGPGLPNEHLLQLQGAEDQEVTTSPSSSSSTSSRFSLVFQDTTEDEAAAGAYRVPQSSPNVSPTPRALAALLYSLSQEEGVSSQHEEVQGATQGPAQALPEVSNLVCFLLLKYGKKETTSKAEMLREVLGGDQEHFLGVFSEACKCMQLVFGVDVAKAEPNSDTYVLATTLGLTYDGLLSPEQTMPKTGLLVVVLGVILLGGDCAPEEHMWEALGAMGLCEGSKHFIFGEPRELLTEAWVREQYLEYRQVPGSDPPRSEFLWGPRAHAEANKMEVLARFLKINSLNTSSFLPVSWEAGREEQEEA
ncbi:Melanoma-associated antigen 10 [Galemys pyrenaicus]|uniref:Melanoma-associated antigen 10 n=1 Tax=Galemys pyrenaicus TaxID=202257 RepID=A0A8J6AV49_GALPY|nr:Melanoma-associated antigen 10 [Galemys pyrenaicus]